MERVTIPRGTLSMNTFPISEQGHSYRACSKDFNLTIFIEPPEKLRSYFDKASEVTRSSIDSSSYIYTPRFVEKNVHVGLSHHSAWLLSPPDIGAKPNLLTSGLMIPDLKVLDTIYKSNHLVGHIMISDYAKGKQFFSLWNPQIDGNGKTRYLGLITRIPDEPWKRPVVWVKMSSQEDETLFQENRQKLEEMMRSDLKFWWNTNGNSKK